jgi:murein DD-endopeptidase MepM/ murein hydrolase activator NlpD
LKRLRINIIPENGKVINISLTYRLLKFILALFIVIIIGIGYIIGKYGRVYITALKVKILEDENKRLKQEIAKIEEIKERIRNIDKIYNKLYSALEVEKGEKQKGNPEILKDTTSATNTNQDDDMNRFVPDIYPVNGWISRRFEENHPAIDISAKEGTPIVSPMDGVVKEVKFDSYFGNVIKISNDFGFEVILCHNKENFVRVNDTVKKGDKIGLVGNTGKSTSAHLHYEVIFQGKNVDPLTYLPKGGN